MPKAKTGEPSAAEVKKLHDQGKSYPQIAEELGITPGTALLLAEQADSKNKITGTPSEVSRAIVKQRKEGASWGVLMGRSGLGLATVKRIFAEATNSDPSSSNIGKGGRPSSGNGAAKPKKAVAKKAKKAAPVKKAVKKAPAKKAVAKKARPAKKRAVKESA